MFINFQIFSFILLITKGENMLLYMFFSYNCSKQYLKNTLFQTSRGSIDQWVLTLLGEAKLIKVSMGFHLQLFILMKINLKYLFIFNLTHLSLLFDNVKRGRMMYICMCVILVSLIFRNIMNFQINTSHGLRGRYAS